MSRAKSTVAASLLALLVVGCGSAVTSPVASASEPSSSADLGFVRTQRNDGVQVTVEVTWDGPDAGTVFDVKLDTHSVDLDGLDLSDAELTNDRGESLVAAPWEAPKGGHHREGRLTFGGDAAAFLAETRWIELTIDGVGAAPERVLRWEVPA
jgi:hypothetical protein